MQDNGKASRIRKRPPATRLPSQRQTAPIIHGPSLVHPQKNLPKSKTEINKQAPTQRQNPSSPNPILYHQHQRRSNPNNLKFLALCQKRFGPSSNAELPWSIGHLAGPGPVLKRGSWAEKGLGRDHLAVCEEMLWGAGSGPAEKY